MPKIKKVNKRSEEYEQELLRLSEMKRKMYSSGLRSYLLAAVCLAVSLIFNNNLIAITVEAGGPLDIALIILKSVSVILFFTFVLLGLANNMELKGKTSTIKEIIFVVIISLIQTMRSGAVFWLSFGGIALVIIYIWAIQVKVQGS
jgi:hypothetical protein